MRDFNYELKELCRRNRDGSYATQAERARILDLVANQLREMGFKHMHATSLKPKHIEALVARWKSEQLNAGTFKNRMAHLRWLAEKTGKSRIIERSNKSYGIQDRVYVTNVSKATTLDRDRLARISDPYTHMSLRLQSAFGLRLKESIMMCPAWADLGDRLRLMDSWAKGKREREIPIRNAEQRQLLDEAKRLAGKGSLIPKTMRYVDQMNRFKAQCKKVGIDHVHGLRHQYAQERYRELIGWECPANGGPKSKSLTPDQKAIDHEARMTITRELGHGRAQITGVYIGR
jgi:site-specific recombinase XerC